MRRYFNKAVAAIIATAMIMTSAGSVYADDVVGSSQDSDSIVSETDYADQNISDEADETDIEEIVSEETVQEESTINDSMPEGTEEIVTDENESTTASGVCGQNLTWSYVDGTLTISGTGDMYNYRYMPRGYYAYEDQITNVIIEEGVTNIGGCAFLGLSNLTTVNIPEGVTTVEYAAFMNCTSLTSIDLPETITGIEVEAFQNCSSLENVIIPSGVFTINSSTFSGCSSLQSVTIRKNVKKISDGAFAECGNLSTIYYTGTEEGWKKISIESENDYLLSATVQYIDGDDSELSVITGTCGENANWSLDINNKALLISGTGEMTNYIENEAPWENYTDFINSVTIENGLTTIGNTAFHLCANITNIKIPNSVTNIGDSAFSGCDCLSSIELPENLTSIGDYAFSSCSCLSSLKIPESVKNIGKQSFVECSSLSSIELPENLTSIGDGAFMVCSSLSSIVIPERITTIGWDVFFGCSSLVTIYIPKSVTNIDTSAFSCCDALADIYYAGSEEQWNSIEIADYGNDPLSSATIHYNTTPVVKPRITSQPVNATVALKAKATFSVSAKNVVSYQWQYSKNNGSTWSNLKDSSATSSFISGTTTDTLTILTTNTRCGYVYRCQLTGENGDAVYTNTVTLSKIPQLNITTQPVDTVGSLTKRTTFTVVAENAASYQWQYSKNSGTSWNTLKDSASSSTYIGGCTTGTLTLLVNSTRSGYVYRCKVTGQDGTVKYTNQAAILLFTITTQPKSVQAKSGNTVTFSVGAENAESYQWYYQKEGSTTWNKLGDNTKSSMLISGSTTDTLTIKMTKTRLTFKYRCKVKGQDGTSKYTDTVEISS